jgi:hypothetical protein
MLHSTSKKTEPMNPLLKNQLIGGICAILIVIFVAIRIFVLHASIDGIFMNLISVTNAVLSLVVLTSAVRILLSIKKHTFEEVFEEKINDIDKRYGALIEPAKKYIPGHDEEGTVYSIGNNLDAVFTPDQEQWDDVLYLPKFAFSPNFVQTRKIYYYVNYVNMKARAARMGDDIETTGRLLARDTAVAIQRSFSDILTAHAVEVTHEEGRAVVTINVNSTKTAEDAKRIAEVIDYMLFLHFVVT